MRVGNITKQLNKVKIALVMGVLILCSAGANATTYSFSVNAGCDNLQFGLGGGKVFDSNSITPLPVGSVVQYIYAGPNNNKDLPSPTGGTTGDDRLLAAYTVGSDTVVYTTGGGPINGTAGLFYHNANGTSETTAPKVYVRAWNAASTSASTYYGDSDFIAGLVAGNPCPQTTEIGLANFSTNQLKPAANNPPTAPSLSAPDDAAPGVAAKPAFSWSVSTDFDGDPVTYTIKVSVNSGFTSTEVNKTGLTATNHTLTANLAFNTTYYWKVTASDGRGGNTDSAVRSFTTVQAVPAIRLDHTSLSFSAVTNGTPPASKTVVISNSGTGGDLSWTATKSASWLTIDPTYGNPGTMTVSVNPAGLPAGPYSGTINFTSNGGAASVEVSLTVTDPDLKSISPSDGTLGQNMNTTLTFSPGTNWTGDISTNKFSFSGGAVSDITVNSATGAGASINLNITISPTASTGSRTLRLTTGSTGSASFTIYAPTLSSISPITGTQGQSYNVAFTGSHTLWKNGLAGSGPAVTPSSVHITGGTGSPITVDSITIIADDTHFTANITVPIGASTGSKTVSVEGTQGSKPFTVTVAPVSGLLQFSTASYSVNENGGTATITVTRMGGSSGPASVNYTTSNGTAIADTDYTAASGILNWADGEAASKTFIVAITDDAVYDGNKTLNLTLSSATGATLATPNAAILTINDNETPVATLTSIAVTPATPTITAGNSQPFVATGTYSIGPTRDITSQVTWQSLNPSAATINTSGLATGVAAGTSTVKAISGLITGQATLTVNAIVPVGSLRRIVITPASVTVNQGESVTFIAKGYDANGNETADILTYASDLGDDSTTVTANVAAGEYLFAASSNGISATATINVKAKYDSLTLRINKGKISLYTKDALGNESLLTYCNSLVYEIAGSENGNNVTLDGTIIEGTVDGTYVITATATIGSLTLTGTNDVTVNKKAPTMIVKIDGQDLANNIAISNKPKIDISASDGNGVKSVKIYVDGTERIGFALNAAGVATASYTPDTTLAAGSHTIMIEAEDANGVKSTISAFGLKVYADVALETKPMNFPNPFKPSVSATTIYYKLTKAADTKIAIYDVTGRMVFTQTYLAGNQGGLFGENMPTWTGKAFSDTYVGNGVYMYFITSNGKVLGSGEISVNE